MIIQTNTTASTPSGGTSYTAAPAILVGNTYEYIFPFCCTARDLTSGIPTAGNPTLGRVTDQATRTATTCFMRGYSEAITIQTTDGLPWLWRRIVFTYKGLVFPAATSSFNYVMENSAGYARVVNSAPAGSISSFINVAFKGVQNADWNTFVDAPLDTSRISVLYDKTMTIASGNEDGMIRKYKFWHPFNKNLVYDDEESGGSTLNNGSYLSVSSKAGMGDAYIVDFFRPRTGGTTASQLSFHPQGTLYWHEK
ncbi:capsid protein [Chifec genomovirus UA13_107]|nr:capsid protein [Chifec genomovirus UA13_107]